MTALVDAVTGLRNTRRAIGDGTLAGRHLLATPAYPPPRAKGQTATHDDPAVDGIEPGHLHIPSTLIPSAVVAGPGDAGGSGELGDALHVHPFTLSALTPAPITDAPGAPGVTGEPSDAGHSHEFDAVAAGIPPWDVAATPDTLALRSPTGTLSVAAPTAGAHAIPNSETSVPPTANAIARRNAAGQTEVADATAALHALNRRTGDARYTTAAALQTHIDGTGTAVHGATPSSTGVNQIMSRDANGEVFISATSPGAVTSVLSRQMGDARYSAIAHQEAAAPHSGHVNLSTGANPQVMTNRLQTPAGTAAAPGLAVGGANLGLFGDAPNNTLNLVAGGASRAAISGAGLRPTTAGLSLGLIGSEWGQIQSNGRIQTTAADSGGLAAIRAPNGTVFGGSGLTSNGVIETTKTTFGTDPAISAPNGSIVSGAAVVAGHGTGTVVHLGAGDVTIDGSVYADGAAFGIRTRQVVAVTGGTGAGQGMVIGTKDSGNARVQVEAGLSYRPIVASSFDPPSDARTKAEIRDNDRDDLADVLATPTSRFRRREQVPIRPEGADERTPPTEIREKLSVEEVGWLANDVTPDVAVLLGDEVEGWHAGISLGPMLAKLWHAFQQEHAATAARLDALESR